MMGMSDPYQRQSTSATGQNIYTDTSMTPGRAMIKTQLAMDAAATKMTDTFKKISDNNTAYANAGAKHTIAMQKISGGLTNFGDSLKKYKDWNIVPRIDKMKEDRLNRSMAKSTPEEKEARKAARTEKIGRAGNAMMMGSMVPMMASSMVEDPRQQKALMGAGMAMGIIPMLTMMGPVAAAATVAVGGLAAAFVMMRKHVDGLSKSSAVAGSNIGGAANRMETIGAATGYGFASTRTGNADFRFTEKQAQDASEVMPYFDTDEGKKLVEEMKKLSSQQRYEKVASMLTFAIADGMSPDKAEAFGSSIAFALDDALLKSKVIALIKSGTLESGSQAMINEINKRQQSLGNDIENVKNAPDIPKASSPIPGVSGANAIALNSGLDGLAVGGIVAAAGLAGAAFGSAIPVIGTAVGLIAGVTYGMFQYNKSMEEFDKQLEVVGKTFGSSIQTIKELNNAESLLREERKNGSITLQEFEAREKQIEEMRNTAYENISAAVVNLPDAGAASQAVSDQLQLGGFEKDDADLIARQTDRDKVSAEMFQKSFDDLDANQKEIIGKVVASTLDGITPENYATKLDDIKNVWALYKEALLEKTADGVAVSAQEMQSLFEESQLKNFVSSLNIPGGGGSPLNPNAASQQMQTAIESSGTALSYDQIVNALTELGDPKLALQVGTNADSIKDLETILTNLPDGFDISMYTSYLNGSTKFTNPEDYTKSIQDVIDKIAEVAPEGFDPIELFKLFEGTGKDPIKEMQDAVTKVDNLINQSGGDNEKTLTTLFESVGYDATQKEIDAFNALPASQQKTYLTSFVLAMQTVGEDIPVRSEFAKFGLGADAAYKAAMAKVGTTIKERADSIQALNLGDQTQSPFEDPSDGPGGGGRGPSAKDKEADRLKKLNDLLRERFELQQMAIDKDTEVYNNSIDKLNRQIELEERQVKLRQRGLEELSKKEEAVNDAYNLRVEALDKVSESNSRIGEQERSRISLASALASGDIAAAANITSEMQQQSAQYQIEDARAALEKQRQIDLDALTVSINGKLMTRKGIEFEIEQIQDRIYNKGIEIQGLQDKLLILEDERLVIAKEREKVETRTFLMAQRQAILDLTGKNGKVPPGSKQAYDSFVNSFNAIRDIFNRDNPGAKVGKLNYGGSIAKMANGGIAYKGSTEPPPPIMMNDGFTVPGKGMTDKVSALLTPGEFVVRKSVADKNRGFLQALNGQVFPGIGGKRSIPKNNFLEGIGSPRFSMPESGASSIPVNNTNIVSTSSPMYNSTYNVNVNVAGTNASPDDIANVVMAKISNQNRGNLRSSRY
jgi:hypothetical protein